MLQSQFIRLSCLIILLLNLTACGGGGSASTVNVAPKATNASISLLPGSTVTGMLIASDVDSTALSYRIVTDGSNGNVKINDTTTGAYTYVHGGSAGDDSFSFVVSDGLLDSNIATVTVATTMPQTAPVIVSTKAGDQHVELQWDPVVGAESYAVYWSTISGTGTGGTRIAQLAPPFFHRGITNGAVYYYVVTAVNAVGESTASSEVAISPVDIRLDSLTFVDAALGGCVTAAIASNTITFVHELTTLSCNHRGISQLAGIEALTGLTKLDINSNTISDVSPLSGLTGLTYLYLLDNTISDVSPLSGLTGLTSLYLSSNTISDVSPLSGLTGLTILYLNNNMISNVSPLSGLIGLTSLGLNTNTISDVSPLSGLTGLTLLYLNNNMISNVSPLSGLTGLIDLYISSNTISDVSPLSGLNGLILLLLTNNTISDVSPLSGLTGLTSLYLSSNTISDVSPLSGLTGLTILYLNNNMISNVSPLSGLIGLTSLYLGSNTIGSTGAGNVDKLSTLKNTTVIDLSRNKNISCTNLTSLITTLGSPPVDVDLNSATRDTAVPGVNCTAP